EKILDTAKKEGADIIGLSGLITPSLDEMVYVAREMERRELCTPLLIGGATTSKIHTAVKIAPEYSGTVVHVLDAYKCVHVASSLLSEEKGVKETFVEKIKTEYIKIREDHERKRGVKNFISIEDARANKYKADWEQYAPVMPTFLGVRKISDVSLEELVKY